MNTQASNATHTTSRDFFVYILNIITLFASVISLNALIFDYIDYSFPNILEPFPFYSDAMRTSIAVLIVMFPVFLGLAWFIRKDIIANPEKREGGVRKFLVYFTLFIAALVIIIDLITLVNNFLNGDLTTTFALKVITVLLTASAVFGYYFWDLKRATLPTSRPSRILAFVASLFVIISIVSGFFIVGFPATERMRRMDDRRANDLHTIQYEIINYYTQKEVLPNGLSDLRNDISGFTPPQDPETNTPYEYKVNSKTSFNLCAIFKLESDKRERGFNGRMFSPYPGSQNMNWDHSAGRVCFTRKIDPALYKKQPPIPY